jgi:glycosyltransferase involved in cell wall biosynthesis/2-polyprenyl-3-methyl-5-hydroxy-6-metoxy-1,4-benzoquinol methylase
MQQGVRFGAKTSLPSFRLVNENHAPAALHDILQELEERREHRWRRDEKAAQLKLHWRAAAIQHIFHTVPGQTILEIGAGSGMLAEQLHGVLQGENPLTSIVFSPELYAQAKERLHPDVDVRHGACFQTLSPGQFDYVIGIGMLWHDRFEECLRCIHRVLKPGGQMLFFEANFGLLPRSFNDLHSRPHVTRSGRIDARTIAEACSAIGFEDLELTPHDIVSCRLGLRWMTKLESKAVLLEHMPVIRSACASLCLFARKEGKQIQHDRCLADIPSLYGAVSVVVPAHNEAANIPSLVERLLHLYGPYIHEIVIVNDNSTDETAAIVGRMTDSRIRLVNRSKPNGVGRALKDGYRAATGRYILSMDCDFIEILPQLRPLFRAVANGHDGAIGSRFSHESILVNYPFFKLLCNRLCHALIQLFLVSTVRDITNNLKLYRTDILKGLEISSPHFSANLETGLRPLLAGYDIVEVPTSWIDRTSAMGFSNFKVREVGLAYARTLVYCWIHGHKQARGAVQLAWRRALKLLALSFSHPL